MQKVCSNNSRSPARFEAEGGQYALNLLFLISKATLFRVKFVQLDRHNTRISSQTCTFHSLFSSTFSKDFPSRANFQTCSIFESLSSFKFKGESNFGRSSQYNVFERLEIPAISFLLFRTFEFKIQMFEKMLFLFRTFKFRIENLNFKSNFEM